MYTTKTQHKCVNSCTKREMFATVKTLLFVDKGYYILVYYVIVY